MSLAYGKSACRVGNVPDAALSGKSPTPSAALEDQPVPAIRDRLLPRPLAAPPVPDRDVQPCLEAGPELGIPLVLRAKPPPEDHAPAVAVVVSAPRNVLTLLGEERAGACRIEILDGVQVGSEVPDIDDAVPAAEIAMAHVRFRRTVRLQREHHGRGVPEGSDLFDRGILGRIVPLEEEEYELTVV
jgi:hypothetical protein